MPKKKPLSRSDIARRAVITRWARTSQAERTAYARKLGKARWAKLTNAERRELAARGGAASKGTPKKKRKDKNR